MDMRSAGLRLDALHPLSEVGEQPSLEKVLRNSGNLAMRPTLP
jgi:hypothetical protein